MKLRQMLPWGCGVVLAGLLSAGLPRAQAVVTPATLSVTVPTNRVYLAGDNLDFAVNLNENVLVDTNAGLPSLLLDLGGSNAFAGYVDGNGSNVLTFRHVVQASDRDADGIGVGPGLQLNGSIIVDQASNALDVALNNIGPTSGVLVDGAVPLVTNDTYSAAEDAVLNGTSVLLNDFDGNGDLLTAALVSGATNGVVVLNADGTFTYAPSTNFHGADAFTYRASDGTLMSGVGVANITVAPANDAPGVAVPIPDQVGPPGLPFAFTFGAGTFTDVDGDVLTYSASGLPPGIAFAAATRTFSGTPTNSGTYPVEVVANDGQSPPLTATNTFSFVVGKITLLAMADNLTRSYSAINPPLTITYSGLVGGDSAFDLTNPPVISTTASNRSPIGIYPITLSGGSDSKYSFVLSNATLTITNARLIARAEDKVKEFGAPNPALTIRYTGFAAGDSASTLDSAPTVDTTATTGSPAGLYPITITGGSDTNYDLVLVGGALTIRQAGVARASGTFYGLFYESDQVRNDRSGSITVTTRDGRAFSAVLQTAGRRHRFSGVLDVDGRATNGVARRGDFPLFIELQLGREGVGQFGGRVTDGSWSADLVANYNPYSSSTNPAPQAGTYTMVIPGVDGAPTEPYGHSHATLSISKRGKVSFKARLCDDTKASAGMFITGGGTWPFYLPLYSGGGSMLGWLALTNQPTSDIAGKLNWTKPFISLKQSKTYPFGFAIESSVYGARYTPPRSGTRVIDLPVGSLNFTKGVVVFPLSTRVQLTTHNVFLDLFGTELPVKIRTHTGFFSGSFLNPFFLTTVSYTGILVQKTNVAAGFYVGDQVSGRVDLVP